MRPPLSAPPDENPAQKLARCIRGADRITIFLGRGLNEAHQAEDAPVHLGLKTHLVQHLSEKLKTSEKKSKPSFSDLMKKAPFTANDA